jgi:hypothetical protein
MPNGDVVAIRLYFIKKMANSSIRASTIIFFAIKSSPYRMLPPYSSFSFFTILFLPVLKTTAATADEIKINIAPAMPP